MTPPLMTAALAAIRAWYQRRATIHTLEGLDDRLLKDIGIDRNQIPTVVETAVGTGRPPGPPVPEQTVARGARTAA